MGIDVVNTHYICQKCSRQFVESYSTKGYSQEVKEHCLKLYVHGIGFRGIERATGVNHNSVINWVKQAAKNLPNAPDNQQIPEITQVDELETFIGKKQNMVVDSSE